MNTWCVMWSASSRLQFDIKHRCCKHRVQLQSCTIRLLRVSVGSTVSDLWCVASPSPSLSLSFSCDWTLARNWISTGWYCVSVPLWDGPNNRVGWLKDAAGPDGFKVCLFCHKQCEFQQLSWNKDNMYHHLEELPGRCVFMCRRSRNELWPEDLGRFWFYSMCRATACLWFRSVRQDRTAPLQSFHLICGSNLGCNNFALWELIQFL